MSKIKNWNANGLMDNYNQSVWIGLAHRFYTDVQYFFLKAKCGVKKKRHDHNFDFSGLKRIAGLVHPISYPTYSFQVWKIKIVAVSFFFEHRLISGTLLLLPTWSDFDQQ